LIRVIPNGQGSDGDLTEHGRAGALPASHELEEIARLALDATALGLCVLDLQGRLIWANRACARLLGYSDPAALLGQSFHALAHPRRPDGTAFSAAESPIQQALRGDEGTHRDDACFGRADGRGFPVEYWSEPLRREGIVIGAVITFLDISARQAAEARVRHLAYYDALTDLPNRVLFHDRLEMALARCRRQDRILAVHLLDLDHFKAINDAHGHAAGDALLRAVADRLRNSVRATDTVARLGGDEFAVLQADLPDVADAITLAGRLVGTMAKPFLIDRGTIRSTASIGSAVYPRDGPSHDLLLQNADRAMYLAKSNGRNTYRLLTTTPDWIS
jgi:diguanylate cyclase (GGDEF)-like protein/PAS domain S-box-containing protein